MYLQEPSTPLMPARRRIKKKKGKEVDSQVAEFLAFETHDFEKQRTADSKKAAWLVIYDAEDGLTVEDRVEAWLTEKGIKRSEVDTIKYDYFSSKKESISRFLDDSPVSVDGEEAFSPISSPTNFHRFFNNSKLGTRRLGFGASFHYSNTDIRIREEFTLHRLSSIDELQAQEITLGAETSSPHSPSKTAHNLS